MPNHTQCGSSPGAGWCKSIPCTGHCSHQLSSMRTVTWRRSRPRGPLSGLSTTCTSELSTKLEVAPHEHIAPEASGWTRQPGGSTDPSDNTCKGSGENHGRHCHAPTAVLARGSSLIPRASAGQRGGANRPRAAAGKSHCIVTGAG
jgi:hypothetical protein